MANGYDSSMQLDSVLRHVRHIPPLGELGEPRMICLLKTFGRPLPLHLSSSLVQDCSDRLGMMRE